MIPPLAFELIITFEGFRARPYLCPARVPTIGYGSTRHGDGVPVKLTDPPISEHAARALLEAYVVRDAAKIVSICPLLARDSTRFASVISWVYNLGLTRFKSSTFRRKVRGEDWAAAAFECRKWVFESGKKSRGLILRREIEARLLLSG